MGNDSDRYLRENQSTRFMFDIFFPESLPFMR